MSWQNEARDDADAWAVIMPKDACDNVIDWEWIQTLNLAGGVGVGSKVIDADTDADPALVRLALVNDLQMRNHLEPIIKGSTTAFTTDFDRVVSSFRLPRALAYANRRLTDEIHVLSDLGERMGLWHVTTEEEKRAKALVFAEGDGRVDVSTIIDDSLERAVKQSAVSAAASKQREEADRAAGKESKSDWKDAYLPGRDVDTVLGIDIETTGIDPAREYIIDVGFEMMNMVSAAPETNTSYQYEQDYYQASGAYNQARLSFGVPENNAKFENQVIEQLTSIDVRTRAASSKYRVFDEWPDAQAGLLMRLTSYPVVEHNAQFEHGYFMLTVAGYAEAYRNGDITLIDTMRMSVKWDEKEEPLTRNTLDHYSKRHDALDTSKSERHLGLEDAHIMLVAMRHHLAELKRQNLGPWGPDGKAGVGGRHCRKRYF